MARILVTGGAGFIGSHLVDALVSRHQVTVIDNLYSGKKSNVHPRAKLIITDIRSKSVVDRVKKLRPAYVFHLAAQMNVRASIEDPQYDAEVNVLGSLNIIRGAIEARAKRFIFSSSGGAVYGESPIMPIPEETSPNPEAPYGVAKYSIEHYLRFFERVNGLSSIFLRYANVYGPRQNPKGEAGVVAIFAERIRQGQPLVIFGNGRQTRDYIFVGDVVNANLAAMRSTLQGPVNVGTGRETSVNQLVKMIMQRTGRTVPIKHGPAIPGELLRNAVDPSLARRRLNWRPRMSLAKGIDLTLPYFGFDNA